MSIKPTAPPTAPPIIATVLRELGVSREAAGGAGLGALAAVLVKVAMEPSLSFCPLPADKPPSTTDSEVEV